MTQSNEPPRAGGTPEDTDEIGHCRAPKHSRWKKGQSGNRRGRPPGFRNRKSIVQAIAQEIHEVKENGKLKRRTTLELVLLTLRNLALEGRPKAFRVLEDVIRKYTDQVTDSRGGYALMPAKLTCEEFKVRAEIENLSRKPPPGY